MSKHNLVNPIYKTTTNPFNIVRFALLALFYAHLLLFVSFGCLLVVVAVLVRSESL